MTKFDLLAAIVKYKETNNWDELMDAVDSYEQELRQPPIDTLELAEYRKCPDCGTEFKSHNRCPECNPMG